MTGVQTEVEEEDTSEEEQARQERIKNKPPISECLSLYDFEVRFALRAVDGEPIDRQAYVLTCDRAGRSQVCLAYRSLGIL